MIELRTVNDIFFDITSRKSSRVMFWQNARGEWLTISPRQVYQRVRAVAQSFLSWGIKRGDRIAILSENRWEWAITDFASLAIGAVDVPIYPTLLPEQIAELLADAGSRIVVVSTKKQYEKIIAIRHLTAIEHVILMDEQKFPDAILFSSLIEGADQRGTEIDSEFERRAHEIQPSDIATLIYTSGTTGEPKGVVLTHGNMAANLAYSTTEFDFDASDLCISFLPLSHITARHLDYVLLLRGASLAYCPTFDLIPSAMKTLCPTVFVAVPRVYEKIRQEIERRAAQSPLRARMLSWSLSVGRKHRETMLRGEVPKSIVWKLLNKVVLSKIHAAFGGKVRYFVSGGAPLGAHTGGWFADAGIRILEGYGLTETSPVIALNNPKKSRLGSVGPTLPNVECCIAQDGELLVRGPSVFQGYWNNPEATQEAFDVDGWFRTGDIARFDDEGFLFITDRKKELIKTSGGKFIAPQPIENKLKANALIGHAALVGDRHKFASVLISPDFAALEDWASKQGLDITDREQLVKDPKVIAQYKSIVQQVNKTLANFETIKRVKIVPEEWGLESGELTPSLKLKRRVIYERYAKEVASFYQDEAVSHS
jgi:long-chain acyl-CoA synthetase